MKMRLLFWLQRALTIVQVIGALWWLGLLGLVAGSTPFHGMGAAMWDGYVPNIPGARWFLWAAVATSIMAGATWAKRWAVQMQLRLVLRGE